VTSGYKMLKCIKQTVRTTAIKYQYNLLRIQALKKYYKRPSSSPTGCKKMKKDGENKNIMEKRNGSLLRRTKTFYQILGRAAPLTFKFFQILLKR